MLLLVKSEWCTMKCMDDMQEVSKYLLYMESKLDEGKEITDKEMEFAYEGLASSDPEVIVQAAVFLTCLEKEKVERILVNFSKYSTFTQMILIPLIACLEYVEPYEFLLKIRCDTSASPYQCLRPH